MKKALGPVTLAYPMPAFLVAAYDEEGKANIMTAAWGGICCSNPPCIAVSVRPERWTHKAIVARKAFTVCVPSAAQAAMVDFAGMVSGAREDKFSATGLTGRLCRPGFHGHGCVPRARRFLQNDRDDSFSSPDSWRK